VGQCAGLGELGAGANEGLEARRLGDQQEAGAALGADGEGVGCLGGRTRMVRLVPDQLAVDPDGQFAVKDVEPLARPAPVVPDRRLHSVTAWLVKPADH